MFWLGISICVSLAIFSFTVNVKTLNYYAMYNLDLLSNVSSFNV